MTEREMIEMAARAMGMAAFGWQSGAMWITESVEKPNAQICRQHVRTFNPLTDDGDCARMEAAVLINITWLDKGVLSEFFASDNDGFSEFDHFAKFAAHNNRNAARRYASTMVAAEIGRRMT